jgi:hypothetical protein
MRRFKIFWILLVFILFILPVQGFGEEKEYSPEEIIKLLHDLGYEYCKKEPSKIKRMSDVYEDFVWKFIMSDKNFDEFIFGYGKEEHEIKGILEKLKKKEIIRKNPSCTYVSGAPCVMNSYEYLIFRNYKIFNPEQIRNEHLKIKKIKVEYERIGSFDALEIDKVIDKCKAGFCFTNDKYIVNYFFVKTNEGWKLFLENNESLKFKYEQYPLPIPICALVKQYKKVYLKLSSKNFENYTSDAIRVPITNKIKKEILTVIKELERIK